MTSKQVKHFMVRCCAGWGFLLKFPSDEAAAMSSGAAFGLAGVGMLAYSARVRDTPVREIAHISLAGLGLLCYLGFLIVTLGLVTF
jgi:hypothetical protein